MDFAADALINNHRKNKLYFQLSLWFNSSRLPPCSLDKNVGRVTAGVIIRVVI